MVHSGKSLELLEFPQSVLIIICNEVDVLQLQCQLFVPSRLPPDYS
jgi:hypothetical protein